MFLWCEITFTFLQVTQTILSLEGVKSIGHRYGILTVIVQDETGLELKKSIHTTMESKGIKEYDILRFADLKLYKNECRVGSKFEILVAGFDKATFGSISGFGTIIPEITEGHAVLRHPCIILSGHVANAVKGRDVRIADTDFKIDETSFRMCNDGADIAALLIDENLLNNIDFDCNFRSPDNERKSFNVVDFDDDPYIQKNFPHAFEVYIRGASTSFGRGLVTSPDMIDNDFKQYIMIENLEEGKQFCLPGDSGSIVCHYKTGNDKVDVLAMVQGKMNLWEIKSNGYGAIKLKFSLEKLSELHGTVDLCDNIAQFQ